MPDLRCNELSSTNRNGEIDTASEVLQIAMDRICGSWDEQEVVWEKTNSQFIRYGKKAKNATVVNLVSD